DNDIDRRLFFGRDTEKEALLHKVLADNLVVLYARSGLGKTSLLNAGLNQALRDRGFIPLMVRFNDPELDPVQGIYAGIKEIAKQKSIEVESEEDATLWQYFKTTYFWSGSNKMLTPVLILDQFEEFFALHSHEERKVFTRQLADLMNNKIPASLLEAVEPGEPLPYDDNPPNVKIIISIREDYIGQLDEMSREIPDILHHRFRLLPLSREQARQAIIKPSQVQDEIIGAVSFTFETEAVDMMLDFLCKRRERGIIKMTNEVESFQLQLLCQHIEDKIRGGFRIISNEKYESIDKSVNDEFEDFRIRSISHFTIDRNLGGTTYIDEKVVINKDYLGGEKGMQWVMERFYEDQLEKLGSPKKQRVRKLCEKGLISITDRRLSIEEEEIIRRFKVSRTILHELVNLRLLLAEPRVGSIYYELSHDTMVAPIREYQRKLVYERTITPFGIFLLCILILIGFLIIMNHRTCQEFNELKTGINEQDFILSGDEKYNQGRFDEAISDYKRATLVKPKYADAYNKMGIAFTAQIKYEDAIAAYQKAIEIDPKFAKAYNNMGIALYNLAEYNEAINAYKKAIEINPKYADAYSNKGYSLRKQGKYTDAIEDYKKAIGIAPGVILHKRKLAEAYLIAGYFIDAMTLTNELLKEKKLSIDFILSMRLVSICTLVIQGKQPEAADQLKNFIRYYKYIQGEYERDWEYNTIKTFITQYKELPSKQKKLLLQMIDLLESPKKEGDKKLKELEISIQETFK
ncbi:MAG: tetratricopeptide repeat protein, partial [Candidatus Aminicenantes bacterium]